MAARHTPICITRGTSCVNVSESEPTRSSRPMAFPGDMENTLSALSLTICFFVSHLPALTCYLPSSICLERSAIFVDTSKQRHCLPECPPGVDWGTVTKLVCQGKFGKEELLASRAEFLLALRGDRPGSNRVTSGFGFGAIPIFVSDPVFTVAVPFQCWVPWEHLSAHLGELRAKCNPGDALRHVLREWPDERRTRARELMAHFGRDVLSRPFGGASRVAENLLLEAAFLRSQLSARVERHPLSPDVHCGFRSRLAYDASDAVRKWARERYSLRQSECVTPGMKRVQNEVSIKQRQASGPCSDDASRARLARAEAELLASVASRASPGRRQQQRQWRRQI
ncbi:hypothetical protein T492DRAFT_965283 [Pavlovales sp. CCMP2436]|nr:hypothetical protein T492DRAFT_965283 [Pavlovales sp. CCMP2436]|mmetsp:Transcript_33070/g.82251  ORF Transcript_33070/g.82251 Transcript_33070/m.82251 type:complete len:340 (+) Transcript_33070:773-1792(+)